MSENEIQNKGLTVSQAKSVKKALEKGGTVEEAAQAAGITLRELRQTGVLARSIKELLERADLDEKTRKRLGHARLVELAVQGEDLRVALGASKALTGEGTPGVAIQINQQNLLADPEVRESLKTLQIELEGEKSDS
jgi:hypothetical protein